MRFSIGQWAWSLLGAWWALMVMPLLGLMIAASTSSDEDIPLDQAVLDPAVWLFPLLFAVVGGVWCALMVLLLWLTRTHPVWAAALSLAMTGATVARHAHLRHEERRYDDYPGETWGGGDPRPRSQQQLWVDTPPALRLSDPMSPPPNWNQATFSPFHGQPTHDCTPACPRYQWHNR